MRILVTGGAGFVGAHLALAFKLRYPTARVVSLDNLKRRGSELNLPRLREGGVLGWGGKGTPSPLRPQPTTILSPRT